MGNMSYCRFENTFADLEDCYSAMDEDLSESEEKYKDKIISLCADILQDHGHLISVTVEDY